MRPSWVAPARVVVALRVLAVAAASVLLAASFFACNGGGEGESTDERMLGLEAKAHSLEESVERLTDENVRLEEELASLRQQQADFVEAQAAAEVAKEHEEKGADFEEVQEGQLAALEEAQVRTDERLAELEKAQAEFVQQQEALRAAEEHEEEVADFEEGQKEQLAALEEGLARNDQRLDDLDARMGQLEDTAALNVGTEPRLDRSEEQLDDLDTRVEELEEAVAKAGWSLFSKEEWSKEEDGSYTADGETLLERTRGLAEHYGGEVYNIDSREPEERAILVMPEEPIAGNPLIVSLHGYGSNSADHSLYFPLHERVISRGFGLLLPNAIPDGEGNPAWNPTDESRDDGKASADDYGYLAGLVERARELKDFGPVYFFGYSNGGFMAYHMACKGLPGLRAVASVAGTSYYEDSECGGAPPVSVLHIHGTADDVIRYEGEVADPVSKGEGDSAFYAGAKDMYHRWAERAGCDTDSEKSGENLDLDAAIDGAETLTRRFTEGCAEGITVELWSSAEGGHTPAYGGAITEALLDWLLSQN